METRFDVVVIGGGPGGYTAALYAARAGFSALVLEKLSPGGQMGTTDMIDNYPGFPEGINGFELGQKMQQQAKRFGVKTKLAEVTGLEIAGDGKTKILHTKKADYEAAAVVLAMGAQPRELGLPGERELRGRGVSYCATCDGMFYRGKSVAVVGGGNTAVSDVLYLSRICEKVYLVHRRDQLRASKVYHQALEQAENVELVWNSTVQELLYEDTVTGLKVKNKLSGEERVLPVSGVFAAIGTIPENGLVKDLLELDEAGYVKAGESGETSLPGVYVVGDLRTKRLRQVITAAADGANAATAIEEYLSNF